MKVSSRLSQGASTAATRRLTGLQVEAWRLLWQDLTRDAEWMAECQQREVRRRQVRPEMIDLLRRFLDGELETEDLRATFDRRTKTDWDVFGLKGMSGAMFLNQLVKYVADSAGLAAQLRAVLPVPRDVESGHARLRAFVDYLLDASRREHVLTRQLQPARAVFFVTMWWHLQEVELWPGFHPSARRALELYDDLYVPTGEPVDDYFAFRELFLALASTLKLSVWELEYLCWWHQQRDRAEDSESFYDPGTRRSRRGHLYPELPARLAVVREGRVGAVRGVGAGRADTRAHEHNEEGALEHTEIQWLLAKLGRKLGCRVWVAANDRKRTWKGEALGSLSIQKLPSLGLDPDSQRIIGLIDVVWLKGANQVAAAFEVEHTTSVYSGLLRMADLATLSPNLNFPLYIVAPRERVDKVRRELSRPTFQMLELHRRCAFFSSEALLDAAESMMRWASGPAAIEKLASRVDDVESRDGIVD
jgi:hypothetical protein